MKVLSAAIFHFSAQTQQPQPILPLMYGSETVRQSRTTEFRHTSDMITFPSSAADHYLRMSSTAKNGQDIQCHEWARQLSHVELTRDQSWYDIVHINDVVLS